MKVKHSTLAGAWYPADAGQLREMIDGWLSDTPAGPGSAIGLVVPHAGYRYSGPVAAAGYRHLHGTMCTRVVILAPSHRMAFKGVVVLEADAFATPLGQVRIDAAVGELVKASPIRADARPFEDEHSLEIQLPFLQRVLPEASVVPLLFGDMVSEDYRELVSTIERLADDRTAFAVSSDFTHYGWRFGYEPFPPEGPDFVRERLRELDMGAVEPLLQGDAEAFTRYLDRTGATVCGRVPVTAFLTWAGPRCSGELVAYRTSLDVSGDYDNVVSYAAVSFSRT